MTTSISSMREYIENQCRRDLEALDRVAEIMKDYNAANIATPAEDHAAPLTRDCTTCGENKPLEDYPKRASDRSGHANICKKCVVADTQRGKEIRKKEREDGYAEQAKSGMKKCLVCFKSHPVGEYLTDGRTRDGLTRDCHSCRLGIVKIGDDAKGVRNPLQAVTPLAEKDCSVCGETKPLVEFPANSVGKDGRRSDCKTCHNAARKKTHETRYCASASRCLAYDHDDPHASAAILDATNSGSLCRRCQKRAGVA